MNTPHYTSLAAKLLQRHVPKSRLVPGDRERGIAAIEFAMRSRARRRRWRAATGTLAAAAALIVGAHSLGYLGSAVASEELVAIEASPSGRGASIVGGTSTRPLVERASLETGQRLETFVEGGASLRLSTGTSLNVAGDTAFRVDNRGTLERFSLQRGEVSAHVAKLRGSQRFVIATPDAEVEVRGTQFRLRVLERGAGCGNGTRTRLDVSEGVVEVREAGRATLVRAGEHWPLGCLEPAAEPAREAPAVEPHVTARPEKKPPAATSAAVVHAPERERDSSLTAPNDLFQEGVALRRQGDTSGALRAYQALLTRFPSSPLVENAMAERMRLLAKTGDARAQAEARRYLARFPRGFASNEARVIASSP